jgi:hypothetical protein
MTPSPLQSGQVLVFTLCLPVDILLSPTPLTQRNAPGEQCFRRASRWLITRRRNAHHGVVHGVTGSRYCGDSGREGGAIFVHLHLASVGVRLNGCLGEIEEQSNGLGRLFANRSAH